MPQYLLPDMEILDMAVKKVVWRFGTMFKPNLLLSTLGHDPIVVTFDILEIKSAPFQ
jgi:hypothetical protein